MPACALRSRLASLRVCRLSCARNQPAGARRPAEHFVDKLLPDVHRLKGDVEPLGCKVTSSFLMRDPVPQYLSFYHYYIKKVRAAAYTIVERDGQGGAAQGGVGLGGRIGWGVLWRSSAAHPAVQARR